MANILLNLIVCIASFVVPTISICNAPEEAMSFKLTFHGDWSPHAFPKQYPKFRKNAQWSPLVGAVHNASYVMWEEGRVVSREFRHFVNDDVTTKLMNSIKRSPNASSALQSNKIKEGVGISAKTFTATKGFHMLSFAVHLVPSPDWFVGTSKLPLCEGSHWLRNPLTIDLRPFDAGTDQGFMFTSPDFDENPYKPVERITSHYPDHPANSFYYEEMEQLPRIAHVTITRAAPEPESTEESEGPLPSGELTPNNRVRPAPPKKLPSWLTNINEVLTKLPCEVTVWNAWGRCDSACTVGIQRRYRLVQQKPLNGGRKCPSLVELRICNEKMARRKSMKKRCAVKKMKKEKRKYNAKQIKHLNLV